MNREIKFRGKRIDNGEWITGNLFMPNKFIRGIYICPETTYGDFMPGFEDGDKVEDYENKGVALGHFFEVVPESVGEYTGLKDKNGKEIYDGDILKLQYPLNYGFAGIHNKEIIVTISFESGCFWFTGNGYTDCNWHFYNEYEVIGNVFENPELLNL